MVAVTVGLDGISCADFDQTVYDSAMGDILTEATFSDATCEDGAADDDATSTVSLSTEVTIPLSVVYNDDNPDSVLAFVTNELTDAQSSGQFTTLIQSYAAGNDGRAQWRAHPSFDRREHVLAISSSDPESVPTAVGRADRVV